jgi:hypothetical protein
MTMTTTISDSCHCSSELFSKIDKYDVLPFSLLQTNPGS